MDEEERKWKQFEEFIKQAEEEQAKKQPDPFFQRSIGCFIGGILGPILLVALIFLAAALHPDESGGSPVMFFLFMLIAVPVGGVLGAVLSPFIIKWINSFARRNSK